MPVVTPHLGIYSKLPRLPENARGIQAKLDRADQHIEELRALLDDFYVSKPYRIRIKKDRRTREEVFYLTKVAEVPIEISIVAGDALQNIRSALDHLAFRLYAITRRGQTEDIVYFPIAKSSATYHTSGFRGKVECFGKSIAKRIDAIKPYKGGNNPLWRLHELNKIDKHRLLISAVSGITVRSMTRADFARILKHRPGLIPFFDFSSAWTRAGLPVGPLQRGDELYRGSPLSSEEKDNFQFQIEVAFNEPKIGECEPVLQSLYLFSRAAEIVCRSFSDLLLIHKS